MCGGERLVDRVGHPRGRSRAREKRGLRDCTGGRTGKMACRDAESGVTREVGGGAARTVVTGCALSSNAAGWTSAAEPAEGKAWLGVMEASGPQPLSRAGTIGRCCRRRGELAVKYGETATRQVGQSSGCRGRRPERRGGCALLRGARRIRNSRAVGRGTCSVAGGLGERSGRRRAAGGAKRQA